MARAHAAGAEGHAAATAPLPGVEQVADRVAEHVEAAHGHRARHPPTADEIADLADGGNDISPYFTDRGTMKQPVKRVNVDFTAGMLHELDQLAAELNVSRQAVIKSYLRQALDQHRLAKNKTG